MTASLDPITCPPLGRAKLDAEFLHQQLPFFRRPLSGLSASSSWFKKKARFGLAMFQPILDQFFGTAQNNPRFLEFRTRNPGRLSPGSVSVSSGYGCAH
jgi:hypothetical protein